jgi:hypothetical protein
MSAPPLSAPSERVAVWARHETLRLPGRRTACGAACPAAPWAAELDGAATAVRLGLPAEVLLPPARAPDLASYRWITGHQAAFLGWRALRAALERGAPGHDVAALVDLYSVLLLYAGSCPPALYRDRIRPRMTRWHPAFTGEWARDYRDVPVAVKRAADASPPVRAAWRTNVRVHAAVAERLVPQGGSLLQDAGRRAGAPPTAHEHDLYDRFFDTERTDVCPHLEAVQDAHWTLKVVSDLESTGLFYDDPPPRAGADVAALEHRAADVVREHFRAAREEGAWPVPRVSR